MSGPTELPPAIDVSNLRKVYGSGHTEIVAIRDATLQINRGEVVGLFGPSGSGKSTLLTAMALINPPTSGHIVIGGQPVMDGPRAMVDARSFRRQNIGFVFQKPNLIPFLTALENVQVALEINDTPAKKARERALELLEYLSVHPRADNLPVALSGGEQQRVAVARALANNPSLILADEPTASLDGALGRQVMELFTKVAHERHAGVLVVTHDARTLDVFDRILDVEDGRIQIRANHKTQ
ncbi:MAG: ABC transporter [Verrucomicrobia bacterium 61-8]|nr:ABC transporter ATP-binding protein [Verrucomicrobiota bacterium]OJV03190.1 MAG: ABC transporter [Verrucomicrobia bacterium 61-8]